MLLVVGRRAGSAANAGEGDALKAKERMPARQRFVLVKNHLEGDVARLRQKPL